jgi:hypothetical protein
MVSVPVHMRPATIALALALAVLVAGCAQQPAPVSPTPTPSEERYAPGDLLRGDLAGAGFDDPNGTPADAAIVVIEYHQVPDEYVYSLVQPVPAGWAYVYPSGDFVLRLTRDRLTFESYRLERIGRVDPPEIKGPPNASASRPP